MERKYIHKQVLFIIYLGNLQNGKMALNIQSQTITAPYSEHLYFSLAVSMSRLMNYVCCRVIYLEAYLMKICYLV